MYTCKKSMLLLMSSVAISGFIFSANAASWRVEPTITVAEIYTDNVDLDTSSSQSDFITQVTPQIRITGDGSRLNTLINYAPNYFYYPGDDDDQHELRHNLQARLSSELISETFFVDASANIDQLFLDRRQAISSQEASRTDNRSTVQSYQFSPYLVHRIGALATVQLSYDLRHVRQAEDAEQTTANTFFGNSLSHEGSFSVTSGSRFTRLNWGLSALYRTEDRENTRDFDTTTVRADFSYQLSHILTVLGSAGYQEREAELGSFVNFNGFIWDAGFRLVPGPRTSLSLRYGNQNDGDTFSLNAHYKITAKDSINLSFSDTIQTFQSTVFSDNVDVINSPSLNSGFISGDLTRRKEWALTVQGIRGRTTYAATAFHRKNRSDNNALDETEYGGNFTISRNLNQRLSISSGFTYSSSEFSNDSIRDKFWSASANVSYRISKSLFGTLGYVHTDRDQTRFTNLNGGSNYISLSVRAGL